MPGNRLATIFRAFASRIAQDHPEIFNFQDDRFYSRLTSESVALAADGMLDEARSHLPKGVQHPIEALSWQVQADLAVVVVDEDGSDQVALLSVCAPSHWQPAEKLGKSFFNLHTVVPGFERVNATAPKMVEAMVYKGPLMRFVWGVDSDDRLNHHPIPPPGEDPETWHGRIFSDGRFWARWERQSLLGVPEAKASVFVIHARLTPDTDIPAGSADRASLAEAVRSMSPAALKYKGLDRGYADLMPLLER